ncbi:MAG: amidohydrolase family protein [Acidimicrobiia bacterium]|nr:amidohydrolase family protein [Acidimicrobiia bacterium]MYC46196.1 amidohydrolase family protein [Acidimicrobiia bacterium]MYI20031.1 amidohydrolase family protein [Acidimicrobiia bacterium]
MIDSPTTGPDGLRRFDAARVVPCEDETVLADASVVVRDDLIEWVGARAELPTAYRDPKIPVSDAGTATIMPGLVDGHMHISFGEPRTEEELFIYTPAPYRAIRAAIDAEKVLLAGVTAACDPGGPNGVAPAVRDAIDGGLILGPRFSAAGRQITTQLGIGDTLPRWIDVHESSFGALVRCTDDLLQEIRNQVKDTVDLIKIAGSGPGTTEYAAFSRAELAVAVEEAHRLCRPITMHARSRQSVADAAAVGVDWIMHASYMDPETLEVVLEKEIPLLPAMTLLVNSLEAPGHRPFVADAMKRELDAAVAILSKAYADGATLIAGSETGFAMTPYGEWHTREMELFVSHLGMTDMEALLCMTRNAATAAPRDTDRIGTLRPGKFADLLVVDGNPDEDVRILGDRSRLLSIVKGGQEVAPSGRGSQIRQRFEQARRYTHHLHTRAAAEPSD